MSVAKTTVASPPVTVNETPAPSLATWLIVVRWLT